MYLDTDCILALVKDSDWLKKPVQRRLKQEKKLSTSVLSIVVRAYSVLNASAGSSFSAFTAGYMDARIPVIIIRTVTVIKNEADITG